MSTLFLTTMNVKLQYEQVIAMMTQDLQTRDKTLQAIFSAQSEVPRYTLKDCFSHLRLQKELAEKAKLPKDRHKNDEK